MSRLNHHDLQERGCQAGPSRGQRTCNYSSCTPSACPVLAPDKRRSEHKQISLQTDFVEANRALRDTSPCLSQLTAYTPVPYELPFFTPTAEPVTREVSTPPTRKPSRMMF